MRFLIVTQYFSPEIGAPQIRLAALCRALSARHHEVEVVTAMPHHLVGRVFSEYRSKLYTKEVLGGITVHRTWVYAATGTGLKRLLNYLSFTLTCLVGLARSRRPDYLFIESPPLFLGLSGYLYATLRRVPIIFNVADLWPDSVRELGIVKDRRVLSVAEWLEKWMYAKSRFVNATTDGIKQALIERKGVDNSKVLFLPNGADTSLFVPRERDLELITQLGLHGKQVVIYAGTHGVAQGLETLVDAAILLRNSNVVFLFIGDGPRKSHLVERAELHGLNNAIFLGMKPVAEMPRFFSIAAASIVPLVQNELFKSARPSKIFTSLSAGVPVIFSGQGEAADLLLRNRAGLVVPPEDAQALAAAVVTMCQDHPLRSELSANGRKLALAEFDWDAITQRWLDALKANG